MTPAERLHKVMARAGVASRRRSEELILRGMVTVDGEVVRELGVKVDPDTSVIEVMGKAIRPDTQRSYLVLNKPGGYLTTVVDPFGRPTVMKLLAEGESSLFPVGRLDLNSEGLLLLTNDGELAYRLTHPKHKVPKTYIAVVRALPRVLTDTELILAVRAGDERALETLMHRHKGLVRMRARPYFLIGGDRDDLIQEGMIGLFKAVRDFDPGLNVAFRAFAEMCVTRQIMTAIKNATRQKHIPLNSYISLNGTDGDSDGERAYEGLLRGARADDPVETVLAAERLKHVSDL